MFTLVEQSILNSVKTKNLQTLTEDLKLIDPNLTDDNLEVLIETLNQDDELLLEFLGTIAGLGGKFASKLGSKFGNFGNKLNAYSNQKALNREQHSARLAHRQAVRAYGKSLKGGDPNSRSQALASLVSARHQNRVTHGRAQDPSRVLGTSRQGSPKTGYNYMTNQPNLHNKFRYREKFKGGQFRDLKSPSAHSKIYRRLGEAILHQINNEQN